MQLNKANRTRILAGGDKDTTAYLSCRGMRVVLRTNNNKRTCFCTEGIIQGFRSTNRSNLPGTVPTMCPWFVGESLNWHHIQQWSRKAWKLFKCTAETRLKLSFDTVVHRTNKSLLLLTNIPLL